MTKAERFRYMEERAAHRPDGTERKPAKAKRGPEPIEQKLQVAGATEGLDGAGPLSMHNFAARGARRSVYAFEGRAEECRPSRKSTRASSNHIKTDSAIRHRMMKQIEGPTARHQRRSP